MLAELPGLRGGACGAAWPKARCVCEAPDHQLLAIDSRPSTESLRNPLIDWPQGFFFFAIICLRLEFPTWTLVRRG